MKTDFLKELGLEQSVIDKIMAENGKDVESHKQRFDVEKARADGLQTQLAEANKQIESFKGMDIDGIKKNADDYKAKYEAAEKKAKEDLDALRFDHALDSALSGSKARSASGGRFGRRAGKRIAGCAGEVRRRIKDVPFLEKGTKNSALASGFGFAGWKAAAGSHPHAVRRSGKGRFDSGSWMAARSFGTSAKGRRRYRQRQTLSPTGLSTGRLCADGLAGSGDAWSGGLRLGRVWAAEAMPQLQ